MAIRLFELSGLISLESNEVEQSLQNVEGSTNKVAEGFGKALKGAVAFGAAAISLNAVKDSVLGLVKAYGEQESAEARLVSIGTTVTNATTAQINKLKQLAKAQSEVTTFADEVIIAGQSQLLSYGLQTDSVATLTQALTDMLASTKGVTATTEDAIGAANLLGKAFSGQAGALSEAGILLTEQQANLLKTGTEMQRVSTLADILNQNYGQLSQGLRNTTEGAIQSVVNAFTDMKQVVGKDLAPLVKQFADDIIANMPQIRIAVANMVRFAIPLFQALGEILIFLGQNIEMVTFVTASLLSLWAGFKIGGAIVVILDLMSKALASQAAVSATAALSNFTLSGSFAALGATFMSFLPQILLVVAALVALYGIYKLFTGSNNRIDPSIANPVSSLTGQAQGLNNTVNNYNVKVSASDTKEFNDMANFFSNVPRLQRGF